MLFSYTGIGVDVSDHHVRFAFVNPLGRPSRLHEVVLPHGLVLDEMVIDQESLKNTIDDEVFKIRANEMHAETTVLLPESRIFSTNVSVPAYEEIELRNGTVVDEAQENIPLPFSHANVEIVMEPIKHDEHRAHVMAIDANIVSSYRHALGGQLHSIGAMEPNNMALYRLFKSFAKKKYRPRNKTDLVMVVDVGYRWSTIALYDKFGRDYFSRSLAIRPLDVTGDGTVVPLDDKTAKIIGDAIYEALLFFDKKGHRVIIAMLAGVEAQQDMLLNCCRTFTKQCPAIPIGKLLHVPKTNARQLHVFGAAIGAALRSIFLYRYRYDPNFLRNTVHKKCSK